MPSWRKRSFCSFWRLSSYRGHSRIKYCTVYISPQTHSELSHWFNLYLNSFRLQYPVRSWRMVGKRSLEGKSKYGLLSTNGLKVWRNLPDSEMSQRCCHLDTIDFFAEFLMSWMVTIEVLTGISEAWYAASFANLSAISFPAIVVSRDPVYWNIESCRL